MRVFNSVLTAGLGKLKRSSAGSNRRPIRKRKHVWKPQDPLFSEEDFSPAVKRALTKGTSEVELQSEQKLKDEFDSGRNSGSATKSILPDGMAKMPVTEPAGEKRKLYMIVTKESRKYKSVYSPEVPARYPERSKAALSDAINLVKEVLGTSCSQNIALSSYNIFHCDLSKEEVKILKEHEDVAEITRLVWSYALC